MTLFSCKIGEQIRLFRGHPRTPWTVKYHSKDSNIVASGCLGYEVEEGRVSMDQSYFYICFTVLFLPRFFILRINSQIDALNIMYERV